MKHTNSIKKEHYSAVSHYNMYAPYHLQYMKTTCHVLSVLHSNQ